ncbi:MCE family protein [Mycobacterium sp. SMC-2]|uniref:MCE family protein n=1 Tax=Mycobacterium sp. SMC-2 TaxID=2857058 RepID=UPI0037C7968F
MTADALTPRPFPWLSVLRPIAGLGTILATALVFVFVADIFQGNLTRTVPVTVLSDRAGLAMSPDARVKMLGVQVGKVSWIEDLPDGGAAIHLAMDPARLHLIPANVLVDVASTTVFGAKFVQLVPPADPSRAPMYAGQVLDSKHVTIEINTVFQQLTSVLSEVEPAKLNETLGAIASALRGRGEKFGQMVSHLNKFLATVDPSLRTLSHDIEVSPAVMNAYADAAPDLVKIAGNATQVSKTFVEEQQNLDTLLISTIGLADVGNDVVGNNRQALTDVVHLLVPTTDLANQYHEGLTCSLRGMLPLVHTPALPDPGVVISVSLLFGRERYRYPSNLPKVAAKGGPHCMDLPNVPFAKREPFLVTDVGANPAQYGNQGILLNSDRLKQMLFGPIDGPPRNSTQIGQPG